MAQSTKMPYTISNEPPRPTKRESRHCSQAQRKPM